MQLMIAAGAACALVLCAVPAMAQEAAPAPAAAPAGDTVETVSLPSADEQIDVAAIEVPSLDFKPTAEDIGTYDKYYYFHRDNTAFSEALADLRDCDGLARGLASPYSNYDAPVPYPYQGTMAGAIGGAIGNAIAMAVFGSAQIRATRRVNMRRCMSFKGYQRYGLAKDIWKEFNFEESFGSIEEGKRQTYLKQQAKVASLIAPKGEALGR
jgi:hypothetical protein